MNYLKEKNNQNGCCVISFICCLRWITFANKHLSLNELRNSKYINFISTNPAITRTRRILEVIYGSLLSSCYLESTVPWSTYTDLWTFISHSASKFALFGFIEALKDEMRREGHKGLQFTTVCPFYVNTGMTKYIRSK